MVCATGNSLIRRTPARTPFSTGASRQALGFDARLDAAYFAQSRVVDAFGRPAHRRGHLGEVGTEILVAGDRPSTQQRLRFPRRGPAAVVLPVRSQAARQRPLPS